MPSRRLTPDELAAAKRILGRVRREILGISEGAAVQTFTLRRSVLRRLGHDERGSPSQRTALKLGKLCEQGASARIQAAPEESRLWRSAMSLSWIVLTL